MDECSETRGWYDPRVKNGRASLDYWTRAPEEQRIAALAKLREPFPPKVIGRLPRGGVQIAYVGHAAVTDRLLSVDPFWAIDFCAFDEKRNPALDADGQLHILLTVCGVTRAGVGDGSPVWKILVGDALRNAAMRFGVALDLWTRDELESVVIANSPSWQTGSVEQDAAQGVTDATLAALREYMDALEFDAERMRNAVAWAANGRVAALSEMTEAEAGRMLEALKSLAKGGQQ